MVPASVLRSTVAAADLVADGFGVAGLEQDESAIAVTRAIAPTAATFLSFTVMCTFQVDVCTVAAARYREGTSAGGSVPTQ